MHIFIDESGTFTRSTTKPSISLVGSLVLRDSTRRRIEKKYQKLRLQLPTENGEVKGRLLDEKQVSSVVELLRPNDALFEVVAIDLDLHTDDEITEHKLGQGEGLINGLSEAHHPNVHKGAAELQQRVDKMANQLYVQSVLMFELVWLTVELAVNYHAQRWPQELGHFRWTIDGKDKRRITDWENWWATVVMPVLQSKSLRRPRKIFEGGDYTYFEKYRDEIPDWLPPPKSDKSSATNLRLLLMEDFIISSDPEPGLELVDILANAVRRALVGNLRYEGWKDIPRLMIHRKDHYITLVKLHDREIDQDRPYHQVVNKFRHNGRNMIAPRFG